jgi:type I restriction enzyme, S subunit
MSCEGWKTLSIKDICSNVNSGGTPKSTESSFYSGNIPWLNTKEVDLNRIYDTERKISKLGLENSAAQWIDENSVIIAMYGATAGKVCINKIPLTTNQACCNLTIDYKIADYRFVYYYIANNYLELSSLANGGAQQNLNAKIIKDFPITLPSLLVQNKICDILTSLDDKIELNNQINANLEQQAQAIFKSWFFDFEPFKDSEFIESELGLIPKGWCITQLDQCVELSSKAFNPNKNPRVFIELYSIPAFDENKFPVFEFSDNIKSNKYIVEKNNFVISKLNPTTKRIWRPYCLTKLAVCSTEFLVFSCKEKSHKSFFYSLIDSQGYYDFLNSYVTGSTGSRQRVIPSNALLFTFAVPPQKIISEYCNIVDQCRLVSGILRIP